MKYVKPATVIVFDGLRARLPPARNPQIPCQWLTQSTLLSRRYFSNTTRLYTSTATGSPNVVPYQPPLQSHRLIPYQGSDEEVKRILRVAQPGRLYELLRIEGVKGDFQRVQAYAECLMVKHNEAPNLRIYSALILANAHEHGSIASVLDYIQQLRDDGFDLDGGTCHDIIKVRFAI